MGYADPRGDRAERAFVWSVWLVMLLAAGVCLVTYSYNIPLAEDWLLVPALTGHEPDFLRWLWSQSNEHRTPLPKLIFLFLLRMSHGDFRAGMLWNVALWGALALAMIRVARTLRGGRTRFADAVFPVALLHLGNWENLFWSWQIGFVLSTLLACALLSALVSREGLASRGAACMAGCSLMALPLCGGSGLLLVPLPAIWIFYCGVPHRRSGTGKFLLGSSVTAIALTCVYLIGYVRPSWAPPNPDTATELRATAQFLAMEFGPAARDSWFLSTSAAAVLLAASACVAARAALRLKAAERQQALGLMVFLGSTTLFAVAVAWGRAGAISLVSGYGGWPARYTYLAVPGLFACFFVWELYGSQRLRMPAQAALLLGMCFLVPFNTVHGLEWRDFYSQGATALIEDLDAGVPGPVLAERHRMFLFHSVRTEELHRLMRMLQTAGMGPFSRMKAQTPAPLPTYAVTQPVTTREVRYRMPEAGEVYLIWGVDGWQTLPEVMRPADTEVKGRLMRTPMTGNQGTFKVVLRVPAGAKIDYGFLVTRTRDGSAIEPAWDDSQGRVVSGSNVIEVNAGIYLKGPLVSRQFRYHLPDAAEVFLAWGLNGWNVAPAQLRPAGTVIRNKVMLSPMIRQGEIFVASLQTPSTANVDYGFLITRKRGIFDIVSPVWDNRPDYHTAADVSGIVEVRPVVTLDRTLSRVCGNGARFLGGLGTLLCVWFAVFRILGN
ncbi:MAG: hypothetical protein M1541_16455 [Acidobacteria bacterium]|nr:hypothetical protein [Acidobacteriota bacterium]